MCATAIARSGCMQIEQPSHPATVTNGDPSATQIGRVMTSSVNGQCVPEGCSGRNNLARPGLISFRPGPLPTIDFSTRPGPLHTQPGSAGSVFSINVTRQNSVMIRVQIK